MVKIVVLGSGLIPRGYGIAPRKVPFEVDLTLLKTIILTQGLQVYAVNPDTNAKVRLTMQNYEKMYKAYDHKPEAKNKVNKDAIVKKASSTNFDKVAPRVDEIPKPVEPIKAEEVKQEDPKPETPVAEKAEESSVLVPVNNPNNNNNNYNGNYNKHKK